jgi:RNA polymerase sigma factor (sigma-70 family)
MTDSTAADLDPQPVVIVGAQPRLGGRPVVDRRPTSRPPSARPDAAESRGVCDRAAALFTQWRDGRPEALDQLVRLLTPMLWHTVRAYRLDQPSAEDVVQGAWLALVRKQDGVEDPQAVVRWLTVTARREAWRVAKRLQRQEPVEEEVLQARAGVEVSPEDMVVLNHRDQALWDAVAGLPERCQRLLRVVAFADRPDYDQLSRDLGMPVGSIGPTRGRCLSKLRAALVAQGDWRTP